MTTPPGPPHAAPAGAPLSPPGSGSHVVVPHVTPVPLDRRAVAPDVARGLALLGIAIANSVTHLVGREVGIGFRPVDSTTLDRIVDGVVALFVDRRTMPMFALLYGYGIGVVVRRRQAAGVPWPACRADLLRRAGVLWAFGVVHVLLLFEGDVLGAYGLAGLLAVAFVRASDRVLLVTAGALVPLVGLVGGALGSVAVLTGAFGAAGFMEVPAEESALSALATRLFSGAFVAPAGAVAATPLVLCGLWAARRGLLERPADHLPLLRRLTVVGLAVSVLGALPHAAAVARLREVGALDAFAGAALHEVTGMAGGIAFAALVGWVVAARAYTPETLGSVGRAVRAVGTRSLTCYLLQSVLFVLPLAPWAGGIGQHLGSAQVVAWAVGVWLVTVAVAAALERTGRRGPAEWLYRRLVYRPLSRRGAPAAG